MAKGTLPEKAQQQQQRHRESHVLTGKDAVLLLIIRLGYKVGKMPSDACRFQCSGRVDVFLSGHM